MISRHWEEGRGEEWGSSSKMKEELPKQFKRAASQGTEVQTFNSSKRIGRKTKSEASLGYLARLWLKN